MSTPTPTGPRPALLLLAYLAFVSLGLPDGLLGVGWPSIRTEFGVPTEAVGILLTVGAAGYLTSGVLAGFTLARLGVGRLLAGSTLLAGLALTGYASAPGLTLMIGCAFLLGTGSGAIDSGLNAYAAGAFGARHMNWLHAFFGLGVAIGPIIMTSAISLGVGWRWGYAIVAIAQLTLAGAFALTVRAWQDRSGADPAGPPDPAVAPAAADPATTAPGTADPATVAPAAVAPGSAVPPPVGSAPAPKPVPVGRTLRLPAVWLGVAAFLLYVGIEAAAGLWAFLLLTEGRGLSPTVAGFCVSGYWGSLFVGRLVQGVLAERLGAARVLRANLYAMAAGAALIALPAPAVVAVLGLAVLGFAAAPVFPLLTLTTVDRVGREHADRTIGVQIGASSLGVALLPAGIGVLISRYSVELLGVSLLVLAVGLIVFQTVATRRPTSAGPLADS